MKKKMKKKMKRILIVPAAAVLTFIAVEAYMFISLSGVYFHAKGILQGNVYIPDELKAYGWYYSYDAHEADRVELEMRPVWAWHGSKKGSLWIRYSINTFDKSGVCICGSANIGSEIEVEKIDGEWVAVVVHQDP